MFYAQAKEDQHLFDKYFRNYTGGVFVELGALDGVLYSNTKFFEDYLGWTGVLIEPNPFQFEKLKINRPNCILVNQLVSNQSEPLEYRFFHDGHAAVSGVDSTLPKDHFDKYFDTNPHLQQSILSITPVSLTSIVESTGYKQIDLFVLDVEGHELEVLKSYDFKVPIKLIMIESLPDTTNYLACEDLLLKAGYVYMERISHNTIFIHKNFLKPAFR